MNNQTVLLTDYAWPDDTVERHIIESADMKLVTGPATPSPAPEIECLVREQLPG
jgi:D-3-phosphoglycerate dehydrogenase